MDMRYRNCCRPCTALLSLSGIQVPQPFFGGLIQLRTRIQGREFDLGNALNRSVDQRKLLFELAARETNHLMSPDRQSLMKNKTPFKRFRR
jgi:hypothetical protein